MVVPINCIYLGVYGVSKRDFVFATEALELRHLCEPFDLFDFDLLTKRKISNTLENRTEIWFFQVNFRTQKLSQKPDPDPSESKFEIV